MAMQSASRFAGFRCSCAVACPSAHIIPILDTALLLAVSICVAGRVIMLLGA